MDIPPSSAESLPSPPQTETIAKSATPTDDSAPLTTIAVPSTSNDTPHIILSQSIDTPSSTSVASETTLSSSPSRRMTLTTDDMEPEDTRSETTSGRSRQTSMTIEPMEIVLDTKKLFTETQKIAYGGLCHVLIQEGYKNFDAENCKSIVVAQQSYGNWAHKMTQRLYRHLDITEGERKMIEQLVTHGVLASDLATSLIPETVLEEIKAEEERKQREEAERLANQEMLKDDASMVSNASTASNDSADGYTILPSSHESAAKDSSETDEDEDHPTTKSTSELTEVTPKDDRLPDEPSDAPPSPSSFDKNRLVADPFSQPPPPIESTETKSIPETSSDDPPNPLSSPGIDPPSSSDFDAPITSNADVSLQDPSPADIAVDYDDIPEQPEELTPPEPENAPPLVTLTKSDIRHTVLSDLFLLAICDYNYDARSRALVLQVAKNLYITIEEVAAVENAFAQQLQFIDGVSDTNQSHDVDMRAREKGQRKKRYLALGLATLGGGLILGLSAGLAAPLIGAGLGAAFSGIGVTGTTAFLSHAGGIALITSTGVFTGSSLAAKKMAKRTKGISDFTFLPVHEAKRTNVIITIGGWLAKTDEEDADIKLPFSVLDESMGDHYSVVWEPTMLRELGNALKLFAGEVISTSIQQALMFTMLHGLLSALAWPLALLKIGYLIENPWHTAISRSNKAGLLLADLLLKHVQDARPVTLIGYSLGARVIFHALLELARNHGYGLVESVYLFGCPVTATEEEWALCRSVVSHRLVNGYVRNDWILGFLFRATTGGIFSVAGLGGVNAKGVEDIDLTDIVNGHLSYRVSMPRILKRVGLSVHAEDFEFLKKKDEIVAEKQAEIERIEEEERKLKKEAKREARKEKIIAMKDKIMHPNSGKTSDKLRRLDSEMDDVFDEDLEEDFPFEIKEIKSTLPTLVIDSADLFSNSSPPPSPPVSTMPRNRSQSVPILDASPSSSDNNSDISPNVSSSLPHSQSLPAISLAIPSSPSSTAITAQRRSSLSPASSLEDMSLPRRSSQSSIASAPPARSVTPTLPSPSHSNASSPSSLNFPKTLTAPSRSIQKSGISNSSSKSPARSSFSNAS